MITLDKIIERYRKNDNDDGLGTIGWGGKLYFRKNCEIPRLLSRATGSFKFTDDGRCYELDNDYWATEGTHLSGYYPHPFFSDREIKGFKIVKPIPNFKLGGIYLLQYGIENNHYIASPKYGGKFFLENCLEYPEFFEPVYYPKKN